MPKSKKKLSAILLTAAKFFPFVLILVLVVLYLLNRDRIRVEMLLTYTPDNLWLAALVLVALYAVKSLSVFFPLVVLYISAGVMFPIPAALVVNLVGLAVCVTIPYGIGKFSGTELVDRLERQYKKISRLNEIQRESEFFFAFFLRIIQMLPGDVVSMVLGASRMTYWKFVLGSLLGMLPVMVATTIAGSAIADPTSPVFIGTVAVVVLLSIGSFLLWRHVEKKTHTKKTTKEPPD